MVLDQKSHGFVLCCDEMTNAVTARITEAATIAIATTRIPLSMHLPYTHVN